VGKAYVAFPDLSPAANTSLHVSKLWTLSGKHWKTNRWLYILKAGRKSNLLMYTRPYLRIWLPIHALILWEVYQCVLLIRIWCMNMVVSVRIIHLPHVFLLESRPLDISPVLTCRVFWSSTVLDMHNYIYFIWCRFQLNPYY
jgi:hypothetical protein